MMPDAICEVETERGWGSFIQGVGSYHSYIIDVHEMMLEETFINIPGECELTMLSFVQCIYRAALY